MIRFALTRYLSRRLAAWADRYAAARDADVWIGGREDVYMKRWWVVPRNRFVNVYLHEFHRDDDDRAPHDHPWLSVSLSLSGWLREVRYRGGDVRDRRCVLPGSLVFRSGRSLHRMEVPLPGARTIFITGPRFREWGFVCPGGRWVHWQRFTGPTDSSRVGAGCGEA